MSVSMIPPVLPEQSEYNALNYTEQGGAVTHIGGELIIEEGAHIEGLPLLFNQVDHQDASTATTVAALKEDFNSLLSKLIQAGIMEEGEIICM